MHLRCVFLEIEIFCFQLLLVISYCQLLTTYFGILHAQQSSANPL